MIDRSDSPELASTAPWKAEPASAMVDDGLALVAAGRFERAAEQFARAASAAREEGNAAVEADALRRLAELRFRAGYPGDARSLAERSRECAFRTDQSRLRVETSNTIGCIQLEMGDLEHATATFVDALAIDGIPDDLAGRIEQNLGIVASIQGRWDDAESHYTRALDCLARHDDVAGLAMVHHNLAMIASDRGDAEAAHRHFGEGLAAAERAGDGRLAGLCRLNRAELLHAEGSFDRALEDATGAYAVFLQTGTLVDMAGACRILGRIHAALHRFDSAEAFLNAAVAMADRSQTPLTDGEARRELGDLLAATSRLAEAKASYEAAGSVFARLSAPHSVADMERRIAELD
ncbi:MAG: tetratricopeptide repeat protein [Gemmatimonadales bacterium]